jgi:hypothetical protein
MMDPFGGFGMGMGLDPFSSMLGMHMGDMGMGSMRNMMEGMGNGASYSYSSSYSSASGPNGMIYEKSSSTRRGPNGVCILCCCSSHACTGLEHHRHIACCV